MKKTFKAYFLLIFGACTIQAAGQDANDIFRLSRSTIYGSARVNAMGGAFGALGGDISATIINPAASALSVRSHANVTFGTDSFGNTALYYGQKTNSTSKANFNLSQAGANIVFDTYKKDGFLNAVTLGFNYSRRATFDNTISFDGFNTHKTRWAGDEVSSASVIESFYQSVGSALEAGIDINDIRGAEGLAIKEGIIEYKDGTLTNFANYRDGIRQYGDIKRKGSSGLYTFTLGFNFKDIIYLGAAYEFTSGAMNVNDIYLCEEGFAPNPDLDADPLGGVKNLDYFRYNSTAFSAHTFSIGAIARVTRNLRLGLAYKTPTRYSVEDNYEIGLGTGFYKPNDKGQSYFSNTESYNIASYSFTSPGELTASIAWIFGQTGSIDVDYKYKDYNNMRFRGNEWTDRNPFIENYFQGTSEVRAGTEWRIGSLSLRGGFSYQQTPYKDIEVDIPVDGDWRTVKKPQGISDLFGWSAGLGYKFGFLSVDLSYNRRWYTQYEYLYEPYLTDPIKADIRQNTVMMTVGITF